MLCVTPNCCTWQQKVTKAEDFNENSPKKCSSNWNWTRICECNLEYFILSIFMHSFTHTHAMFFTWKNRLFFSCNFFEMLNQRNPLKFNHLLLQLLRSVTPLWWLNIQRLPDLTNRLRPCSLFVKPENSLNLKFLWSKKIFEVKNQFVKLGWFVKTEFVKFGRHCTVKLHLTNGLHQHSFNRDIPSIDSSSRYHLNRDILFLEIFSW